MSNLSEKCDPIIGRIKFLIISTKWFRINIQHNRSHAQYYHPAKIILKKIKNKKPTKQIQQKKEATRFTEF